VLEELFAKELGKRGHSLTWIMQPEYRQMEILENSFHGHRVILIPNRFSNNTPGKVSRRLMPVYDLPNVFKMLDFSKFDMIQVRNDIVKGLYALKLRKKYGIPVAFQLSFPMYDMWKDLNVNNPAQKYLNILRGVLEKKYVFKIMREADIVFPISKQLKEELKDQGIDPKKMCCLPMGASIPANSSRNSSRNSSKSISNKYALYKGQTLIYVGDMSRERKIDFLFHVLKKVIRKFPACKLLLLGKPVNKLDMVYYQEFIKIHGLTKHVNFCGWVPRKEVTSYLYAADISLVPFLTTKVFYSASPTKIFESLSAEVPVVCTKTPEQQYVIEQGKCGLCVNYTVNDFSQAIIDLLNNDERRIEMGQNGLAFIKRERSYAQLAAMVEAAYSNIQGQKIRPHKKA
jgi:glycosyltransferase involved in cell wall biosynthesis